MSDAPRFDPGSPEQEPRPPVVYATPVKRAWAWVGIAYMVIFTLTFTYYLATARILNGIGPVLLVPALLGLAATAAALDKALRETTVAFLVEYLK